MGGNITGSCQIVSVREACLAKAKGKGQRAKGNEISKAKGLPVPNSLDGSTGAKYTLKAWQGAMLLNSD